MKSSNHPFFKSFLYAGRGVKASIRQRNMRFHLSAAALVSAFALVYRLSAAEYGLLFFTIGFILAMEMANSAVEALVDLISPGYHPLAGLAKDLAAGAVLVGALASVAVGAALFLHFPKLTDTLLLILTSWRLAVFLALIFGGYLFTFRYPEKPKGE